MGQAGTGTSGRQLRCKTTWGRCQFPYESCRDAGLPILTAILPDRPHRQHSQFPYLPDQSGYNKRLRAAAPQAKYFIRALATDTDLWTDDLWVADSTPVECGRSRQTARRSALAGWAGYGYCASHSRYFWGLRLHLVTTVHGLPVAFALANPKADEREVLVDLFDVEPGLLAARRGQRLLLDKGYRDAETEAILAARGVVVLRPAYQRETPRPAASLFKALRQRIESVNDTKASPSACCSACWP